MSLTNSWNENQIFQRAARDLERYYPDRGSADEGFREWHLLYVLDNPTSRDLLYKAQELGLTAANFRGLFGNYAVALYANSDEYRAVVGDTYVEDLYFGVDYVIELAQHPLQTPMLGATGWGENLEG